MPFKPVRKKGSNPDFYNVHIIQGLDPTHSSIWNERIHLKTPLVLSVIRETGNTTMQNEWKIFLNFSLSQACVANMCLIHT